MARFIASDIDQHEWSRDSHPPYEFTVTCLKCDSWFPEAVVTHGNYMKHCPMTKLVKLLEATV